MNAFAATAESSLVHVTHRLQPAAALAEPVQRHHFSDQQAQPLPLAGVPDLTAVYYGPEESDARRSRGSTAHTFLPVYSENADPVSLIVPPSFALLLEWGGAYELKIDEGEVVACPRYVGVRQTVTPVAMAFEGQHDALFVEIGGRRKPVDFSRPKEARMSGGFLPPADRAWHTTEVAASISNLKRSMGGRQLTLHSVQPSNRAGRLHAFGLPVVPGNAMRTAPTSGGFVPKLVPMN